jgi:hypothetical protein
VSRWDYEQGPMPGDDIDNVISGPDLSPKVDPISQYYERKRLQLKQAQFVLDAAIEASAPSRLVDAIRDWRDDVGNTGD